MPERLTCECCGATFYEAQNVRFCPRCYEANCTSAINQDYYEHQCMADLKEELEEREDSDG
jgi:hypothetical protein